MARIFKNPNPYSKTLDNNYWKWILYTWIFLAGMALAYWVSKNDNLYMALIGYAFLILCIYIFKTVEIKVNKNWSGEDGEREVRKELEKLSNDYAIFQNVLIGKHLDIDLVLVGPLGVYAIEVKSHRHFGLHGNGKDYIRETISETMGLKEYLKKSGIDIYVNSLLVFSRAFVNLAPQNGVHIMNKKFLIPYLEKGQRVNFDRAKAEESINKLYNQ